MSKKTNSGLDSFTATVLSKGTDSALQFATQFCNSEMPLINKSFLGTKNQRINGESMHTRVFAQELPSTLRTVNTTYFKQTDVVMLVCDMSSRESFEALDSMIKLANGNEIDQPSIIIIGTMPDQTTKNKVSLAEVKAFSDRLGCKFVDASHGTQNDIDKAFSVAAQCFIENNKEPLKLSESEKNNLEKIEKLMVRSNATMTGLGKKLLRVKVDAMIRKIKDPEKLQAYKTELLEHKKFDRGKKGNMALDKLSIKLSKRMTELEEKAEMKSSHKPS